jgi:hypothetical protein
MSPFFEKNIFASFEKWVLMSAQIGVVLNMMLTAYLEMKIEKKGKKVNFWKR